MQVLVGSCLIIELTSTFLQGGSSTGIWMIIHTMQMILILPLMAKFMSNKVKNFIISNVYTSFSFNLYNLKLGEILHIQDLEFDQPNEYVSDLGMQSGSTFINYILLFLLFIFLVLLHMIICVAYLCTRK